MAKIQVEYDEKDIKELILKDLNNKFDVGFTEKDLQILVKSKQNYRSEWESASFKCNIEVRK